jgi:hypothetical protein
MFRAAIKTAIAIITLVTLPLAGAELRFKTMKIPPTARVQIEGSTARIIGSRLGSMRSGIARAPKVRGLAALRANQEFSPVIREQPTPAQPTVSCLLD